MDITSVTMDNNTMTPFAPSSSNNINNEMLQLLCWSRRDGELFDDSGE